MNRKGILLAGGSGRRLLPLTRAINKQLVPIYDKPLVYYSLSTLLLGGIRHVLVISTPADLPAFRSLFGDGSAYGIDISYAEQPHPDGIGQALILGRDFLGGDPVALVLGDNLFHGAGLRARLEQANERWNGATVFACRVADPARYGVVSFDAAGVPADIEEKPTEPRSHFAVTGLYYFDGSAPSRAARLTPSARGELEITDVIRSYLTESRLHVDILGRGIAWLDTGTPEALLRATNYVAAIEQRQGLRIGAVEEVAFRMGFIDAEQLERLASAYGGTPYGQYLLDITRGDEPLPDTP